MPDFTEGWMWLVAGLGATVLVFLFLLVTVFFARRSEQHAHERKP
jgi:Na+-transporting methylmalonyl-CoA/oxaloacetate decarboxylase gamma subunit